MKGWFGRFATDSPGGGGVAADRLLLPGNPAVGVPGADLGPPLAAADAVEATEAVLLLLAGAEEVPTAEFALPFDVAAEVVAEAELLAAALARYPGALEASARSDAKGCRSLVKDATLSGSANNRKALVSLLIVFSSPELDEAELVLVSSPKVAFVVGRCADICCNKLLEISPDGSVPEEPSFPDLLPCCAVEVGFFLATLEPIGPRADFTLPTAVLDRDLRSEDAPATEEPMGACCAAVPSLPNSCLAAGDLGPAAADTTLGRTPLEEIRGCGCCACLSSEGAVLRAGDTGAHVLVTGAATVGCALVTLLAPTVLGLVTGMPRLCVAAARV